ncbi:acid phosphatase [Thecamonas trahens ATCC 50062]|uniref:Acid phosphatase n=1 Tax=Thecamonas trahens ATCC 50062 TaxID=461836 RepID=A0A0L0D3C1_THETB|nr:acid phosphatase [Thecamonas trahens ATCC 50062]KNC46837.1 acid phosphatase [Thecamonas trahens ATCC 50062]|eukprot:XP_013760110.1 acid phosphatase [Thecamonas trahens ATCC 50062]
MAVNPWLIVMSVLGGFCFTLALFIFKHTLWWIETRETSRRPKHLYNYVGWYLGLLLFAVGKILEVVPAQYEGLSWSSVAQMSSLALTVVLEALFLPDTDLSRLDYVAYALIIGGLLCTSPLDSHVEGESFATIFFIACMLLALFIFSIGLRILIARKVEIKGLSAEANARFRKYFPVVLMSEVTLFSALMFASARVTTHLVSALLTIVSIYVAAFIAVFLFQLFQLTLALHDYEFGYVVPLFHVMRRYTSIVVSLMLGRADGASPWTHIVLPIFGMILMGIAVFILHHFRENFSHFRSVAKHEDRAPKLPLPKVKTVSEPENTFANAALAALAQKRAVKETMDRRLRAGKFDALPDEDKAEAMRLFVAARNAELEQYRREPVTAPAPPSPSNTIARTESMWSMVGPRARGRSSEYTYAYSYAYSEEQEDNESSLEGAGTSLHPGGSSLRRGASILDTELQDLAGASSASDSEIRGRILAQPPQRHEGAWYELGPLCGACHGSDSDSSDDDDDVVVIGGEPAAAASKPRKAAHALAQLAVPLQGGPQPKIKANHEDVAAASGSGWLSLGRGVGWHIPLLPDTDRHSQLARADGLHICSQHWSMGMRGVFCCCFFAALSLVYLLVTFTLMVGLYRGCPGVAPFADLPPLPAYNSTPGIAFNHVIQRGNHNSAHLKPVSVFPGFSSGILAWAYEHEPLDVQLDKGNRVFEIDVHIRGGAAAVFHVQLWDDQSACTCLADCLRILLAWSLRNPGHTPFVVGLEIKYDWQEDLVAAYNGIDFGDMVIIEDTFKSIWGDRIVTPDIIRGSHANLTHAVLTDGWPSLDAMRDKMIIFLDDEKELRDLYTSRSPILENRVMFTISKGQDPRPDMAVVKINDPTDDQGYDLIVSAVERGFIVRTRADSNEEYWDRDNPYRLGRAVSSGAQIISFDWFVHSKWHAAVGNYVVGCNNRTAPAHCDPVAINVPGSVIPPPQ